MGTQGHEHREGHGRGRRALLEGAAPELGTLGCSGGLSPWTAVLVAVAVLVVTVGEPYPLGHHGGDGAADLVVADMGGVGAQDHEEKTDGQGHIEDGVQRHRGLQAHEGQRRLLQEGCTAWGEDGTGRGSRGAGHGDTGTWGHRSMETWGYGDMGTQERGDIETRGHWDMETRGHRGTGTELFGDKMTQRHGDMGRMGMGQGHTKT